MLTELGLESVMMERERESKRIVLAIEVGG